MKKRNHRVFRFTLMAWVVFTGLACVGMIATKCLGHDEAAVRFCFAPALLVTAGVFGHLAYVLWNERDAQRWQGAATAVAAAILAVGLVSLAGYTAWNPRPQIRIDLGSSR